MSQNKSLFNAVVHLGDNALILGHRLSEWCGHGPVLEQDIAMTNISLDLIGQARMYLDYAGKLSGENKNEDDLAYRRDVLDFKNFLITEIPNGDFADTIARQFFFDQWNVLYTKALMESKNETLSAIAHKAHKEVSYHQRWSSEWVIRLGDGTPESKEKMQRAIDDVWMFTGEMFTQTEEEKVLVAEGLLPDAAALKPQWEEEIKRLISDATLEMPTDDFMQSGGKEGVHTEYLGFILAEMQYLPRAYPDAQW